MTINEQLQQGQKEHGVSQTTYFQFAPGQNRIRILTEGQIIAQHFFGKGVKPSICYGSEKGCPFHGEKAPKNKEGKEQAPSIKYACYIVKSGENDVLLADLPYSVAKAIGELQENPDYKFKDFPMPYDITVKYDKEAGSPNDMYKVTPSPKFEPISQDVKDSLDIEMSKLTPQKYVEKKKEWQMKNHKDEGIWVSEEKRLQNKKEWVEKVNKEQEAKIASGEIEPNEPAIEYPAESINPDDIPF